MKTWKKFAHIDAKTVDEAASILRAGNATAISGGTDILGAMRFEILPNYPEVVVNLKSIPGLDYIKEEGGVLKIGALTRLEDIAKNDLIRTKYTALAEGAHRTATPHIREMGTISGNICQLTRCWISEFPITDSTASEKGKNLLCHDGRQQISFHLRCIELLRSRQSKRYGTCPGGSQCQDKDQQEAHRSRAVLGYGRSRFHSSFR